MNQSTPTQTLTLGQPAWNITDVYPALDSPEFKSDVATIQNCIQTIQTESPHFIPVLQKELPFDIGRPFIEKAWELLPHHKKASLLLNNLLTFAYLQLSTDSTQKSTKEMLGKLKKLRSDLVQSYQPVDIFLRRTSDALFGYYLSHPEAQASAFQLSHARSQRDYLLNPEQENLITALSLDGHEAWGNLYTNLTSGLQAELADQSGQTRMVGFAQLLSLLGGSDEPTRAQAYQAVHQLFAQHKESCAAVLNALAGWRLEIVQRRSHTRQMDFLTMPLHQNRITAGTLNAMLETVRERRDLGQQACRMHAQLMGKKQLDPWDMMASAPSFGMAPRSIPFSEAIEHISQAFARIDPEMGDFIHMMQKNQWIEARIGPNRQPGAYCDSFPVPRTPRVYMNYTGSIVDVITLAHELGHAFHSWVMRDLPLDETHYPMTLAETASTFGETLIRSFLAEQATTTAEKVAILWQEVASAARFLLNIPVRFDFEKNFYERRAEGQLAPEDFCTLMEQIWTDWYGDSMQGADTYFWASKLHFHLVEASFYNFPYTFGYLFSQGIYAQKQKLGAAFYPFYVKLLRDTGKMTAEDLVQKHLGMDLTQPQFWKESLAIVAAHLKAFEAVVADGAQPCI